MNYCFMNNNKNKKKIILYGYNITPIWMDPTKLSRENSKDNIFQLIVKYQYDFSSIELLFFQFLLNLVLVRIMLIFEHLQLKLLLST